MVLALGLVLGQSAEAGSVQAHHPDVPAVSIEPSGEFAGVFGQEIVLVPACHPGVTCATVVVPEGPVMAMSSSIVIVLRPDMTQSQLLFGGPSVTLPPPRFLT